MRLGIVHTANHRHSRRAPRCNQEKSIHARSRAPVSAVDIARDLAHTFEAHVSDVDAVARLTLASARLALEALNKVLERRTRELAVGKRLLGLEGGLEDARGACEVCRALELVLELLRLAVPTPARPDVVRAIGPVEEQRQNVVLIMVLCCVHLVEKGVHGNTVLNDNLVLVVVSKHRIDERDDVADGLHVGFRLVRKRASALHETGTLVQAGRGAEGLLRLTRALLLKRAVVLHCCDSCGKILLR